jgi:UDP-3-O-[3-hydroxymyristoyl] glucosamine N-acyltransferase
MKTKTLAELAEYVGGRVVGNPNLKISSAATLEGAENGEISFLANRKYLKLLRTTKAAAVVVQEELESPAALLVADDPYYAFTQIVVLLHGHRKHKKFGISAKASIAESAALGKDVHIHDFVTINENVRLGDRCILYPGVFIGPDAEVGDDCVLYPNVVIYDRCKVGNRVIIHANTTVGEDGFGFATHDGVHHKIPHIGRAIIEDDVELGAACAIERGTLEDTVVSKGCKLGDAVVIGHGTRVGPHCLLVPQVGVAGSTTLGHHCVAAGQVGISGHLHIGNRVTMAAQSGVANNLADGAVVFGSPAFDANKAKRAYSLIKHLPETVKGVRKLEKRVSELEKGR